MDTIIINVTEVVEAIQVTQSQQGEPGAPGPQGIQGEKGDQGDQGIQGIQGEKGDKGDQGDQGIQGIQGIQGEKGDKGDQGIQGIQGNQGEKGDKGDQGIQGIQGEPGTTLHSELTDRDLPGNHERLSPTVDSTSATQITNADGTQVIVNVDSVNQRVGINTELPEAAMDIAGTTILRDYTYMNNGAHTGDAVGDRRYYVLTDVYTIERCTVANAVRGAGTWLTIFTVDALGFEMPQYDDILPSAEWTTASGGAAPDTVNHTIGGVTIPIKSFDGGNTQEYMSNTFEIIHGVDVAMLNSGVLELEIHTHGMPSTNASGNVKVFFELVYMSVNAAPVVWGTFSRIITIDANQQYFHKLGGVVLPKPTADFGIGDHIIVSYKRTPTDAEDTYTADWLFMQCAIHAPFNSRGSRQRYAK